jgi:hypothetical protein
VNEFSASRPQSTLQGRISLAAGANAALAVGARPEIRPAERLPPFGLETVQGLEMRDPTKTAALLTPDAAASVAPTRRDLGLYRAAPITNGAL